jgi:choline-sulfatase
LTEEDGALPGTSLWSAIAGREVKRTGFAEYHAAGSRSGVFMLREGALKLVYYVGMPAQLFDLEDDPGEARDLVANGMGGDKVRVFEAGLRAICDPEAVDARAKADQRAKAAFWGGKEAVASEGILVFTPPPGVRAEIEPSGQDDS